MLAEMIGNARAPSWRFRAVGAAFEVKDLLKARGYRWNAESKEWRRDVRDADRDAEEWWLPPVPVFRLLVTLLGEKVTRTVQNTGIHWEGHTYRSDELEELRKRRTGREKKWEIRADPYDRGEVWVLDDTLKIPDWIIVPAVHQRTARGITRFQSRTHLRVARQLLPEGEALTDEVMDEARRIADAQAEAGEGREVLRYLADGALATRLLAGIGIPTILGAAPARTEPARPEPEETDSGADATGADATAHDAGAQATGSRRMGATTASGGADRVRSLLADLMAD